MVEQVDSLEGFLFLHATGGGTGSGLAARIGEMTAVDYGCKKPKVNYSIWPSPT